MKKFLLNISAITVFAACSVSLGCTTIAITKGATADGSVIVAHTDDAAPGDFRVTYVPAKEHAKGDMRAIYKYNEEYPRYVGKDFGPDYDIKDIPAFKPLGYIPEVKHTYGYFDATYAVINEKQLSFAEATVGAKVDTTEIPDSKARLLDVSALSKIAAERCDSAKCAVKLMGELAEKYGYYGWGEILLVADKNEIWDFEICSPPNKTSALWVAKKIPDGTVFAAPNMFRIGIIDPKDKDILYSKNLFDVIKEAKWWDPKKGQLRWDQAVGIGEYRHPYYSIRRLWRIYSRLAPELNLNPVVKSAFETGYPYSIKVNKKLSVQDMTNLVRDHYEGTEFDMTKGLAAGPFGNPDRLFGEVDEGDAYQKGQKIPGAWERPISAFYTNLTTIVQTKDSLPDNIGGKLWLGLDRPYTTVFVPFYIGAKTLPKSYRTGSPFVYDENVAWWAYNFVSNWAAIKYSYIIQDIQAEQQKIEAKEFGEVDSIDQKALELYKKDPVLAENFLAHYGEQNAENIKKRWWDLAHKLIVKYSDGKVAGKSVGYSDEWLKSVGYDKGPIEYDKSSKSSK